MAVTTAVLLLLPLSCASTKTEDTIVGRWLDEKRGDVLEFRDDGTVRISRGSDSYTAEYGFNEYGLLELQLYAPGGQSAGSQRYRATVVRDTLTLEATGGSTWVLLRQ